MKKKKLNLSRLEKLPDVELIKLTKEHKQAILENNNFLDNFEQHFDSFKECYFLLEKKVEDINNFFKLNFKVNKTETGIFSKSIESHLVFNHKTKTEYERKFEEIVRIYERLIILNDKFPRLDIDGYMLENSEKIIYISDKIFNSNHKKENYWISHLFNFRIEMHEGMGNGLSTEIYFKEALSNYKSLSYQLNIPSDDKRLPRAIAEKSVFQKFFNNENSEHEKILRKIELTLRSIKKGKEKTENVGYVYILSNNAYPNIYKIGSTYGLPEERAEELTGTGHLLPFKVEDKIKIKSAEFYEKKIHSLLNKYRVKQNREFFQMELNEIKKILKQVSALTERGERKLSLTDLEKKLK